jgi:hypothetical protein
MTAVRLWKKIVLGLAVVALLALGGFTYMVGGPRNLIGMLRYDQREEGKLKVGDRAPDVTLLSLDGKTPVRLASHIGEKPTVLIFGSFT